MMRKSMCIFSLIALIALLASCSKENNSEEENHIRLSAYSVDVLQGGECDIDILSNEDELGFITENTKIATWRTVDKENGKSIRIKGEGVGETAIHISDLNKPDRSATINIRSHYFSGDFVEVGSMAYAVLIIGDESFYQMVYDEVVDVVNSRSGTFYSFNKENNSVSIDYSKAGIDKADAVGTYQCDDNRLYLTLSDKVEEYLFTPIDFNTVEYVIELGDMLHEKFPEAGVNSASVFVRLSRV